MSAPNQPLKPLALLTATAVLLAGCAAGPDYQAPKVSAPEQWRAAPQAQGAAATDNWWQQFNDPVLQQLISTTLANNHDLKVAAARVEIARAQQRSARSNHLPSLVGNAGASRNKSSEYAEPAMPTLTTSSFRLNLELGYEIDLWGRLRRADEAASARLLASEANRDALQQSLIAEVVRSYLDLRTLDAQHALSEQALKAREDEYALQQRRFAGGVASRLELNQALIEVNNARLTLPELQQQIALQENALSTLSGVQPGAIARGKPLAELSVPAVPAGLPSELLQRRPDLRAAEQELIAANADIGQARAAWYPRLSLTGLFGLESADLSNLLKSGAATWNAGANLATPIFTGGRAQAAEATAQAGYEVALSSYRQSVLNALREVNDALASQHAARTLLAGRTAQQQAMEETLRLAQLRYKNGYSGYLEVLTVQNQLYQMQMAVVQSQRAQLNSAVGLYRALGGNWTATPAKASAPAQP